MLSINADICCLKIYWIIIDNEIIYRLKLAPYIDILDIEIDAILVNMKDSRYRTCSRPFLIL